MTRLSDFLLTKLSIRRFLTLFIIAFILLPCIAATTLAYKYSVNTIQGMYAQNYMDAIFSEIDRNISDIANRLNNEVLAILSYGDLSLLSSDPNISADERAEAVSDMLERHITGQHMIQAIDFIANDGTVYRCGTPLPDDYTRNRKFLEQITNRQLLFSSDTISYDGRIYCVAGKQLYNYSASAALGTLLFYINDSILGSSYSAFESSSYSTFFLSFDKKILSHPNKEYIGLTPYFSSEADSNMPATPSSGDYTVASYHIENPSIMNSIDITGIIANKLLFSTMNKIITVIALCFIITALLAIIVSVFFSKRLISEVLNLKQHMINYSLNHANRIKTSPSNELAVLEESYNRMSDEIDNLISKIEKEQEKYRRAELSALQSQINPHFIYNALDTISWKAKRNKQYEIDKMLITLASFFRISLHRGDTAIRIADEIKHVKSYLYLESLRFPDMFDTEFYVDEELQDKYIVKIILQPIVENSIKHGFSGIDYKGHITISVYRDNDDTVFTVSDNGRGVSVPEGLTFPKSENPLGGYGIYNVDKRLSMYYGENYTLTFDSKPGMGTTVTIRIKNKPHG